MATRIVIITVQKFPFILDAIGSEHRGRKFAIVIDEAHSSQGGEQEAVAQRQLLRAQRGGVPEGKPLGH